MQLLSSLVLEILRFPKVFGSTCCPHPPISSEAVPASATWLGSLLQSAFPPGIHDLPGGFQEFCIQLYSSYYKILCA